MQKLITITWLIIGNCNLSEVLLHDHDVILYFTFGFMNNKLDKLSD